MIRSLVFKSSWGWAGIAETAKGIHVVVLPQASKKAVESRLRTSGDVQFDGKISPRLKAARRQLTEFIRGKRTGFELPLDLSRGTAFQRRVWRTLQRVPYGKLRSYQWVARRVGGAGMHGRSGMPSGPIRCRSSSPVTGSSRTMPRSAGSPAGYP